MDVYRYLGHMILRKGLNCGFDSKGETTILKESWKEF